MMGTTATITMSCLGCVPAIAASEIKVGDTVIWNHTYQGRILNVERLAAKTLRITEQRDCYGYVAGEVTTRTVRADRLVCVREHAVKFVDEVQSETAKSIIKALPC